MDWVCGFCLKELKISSIIEVSDLKHGEIDFRDIIQDVFNITKPIQYGCSQCINLVKCQYDFKQIVLKNQGNEFENFDYSEDIVNEVQKHLKSSNEGNYLTTYEGVMLIAPESKKDVVIKFKHFKSIYEPTISLERVDEYQEEYWNEETCKEEMDIIKMEPNIGDYFVKENEPKEEKIEPKQETKLSEIFFTSDRYKLKLSYEDRKFIKQNIKNEKYCRICNLKKYNRRAVFDHIVRTHLDKKVLAQSLAANQCTQSKDNGVLTDAQRHFIAKNIYRRKMCKICNVSKRSRQAVYAHIRSTHLNIKVPRHDDKYARWLTKKINEGTTAPNIFICVLCEKIGIFKTFENKLDLKAHINDHRKSENFRQIWQNEIAEENDEVYEHPYVGAF